MNDMYKKIPPFKWFVLQNFPFIEEDFDAITNYQLMSKIVEYLNATIDKTNELGEQVETLTNWFENLDVQDEVDNKLDEMTLDGTLAEIINEQIFTELNTQVGTNTEDISALQDAVDSINSELEDIEETINQTKLVVFGDSWTDSNVTDSIWAPRVAQVLNLTLHNYAVNGAGFLYPANNKISSQISTFENDTNVNKSEVKYIVILGGINDYRNSVTYQNLAGEITSCVNNLQVLCPQAKIVYISNCQYPYTIAQSWYWLNLHNYLSTSVSISTLNLEGIIGRQLFNTANYFHLTQTGYLVLARNVVATLTGGEIMTYRNVLSYEDSDIKLMYTTQRTNDMIILNVSFIPKVASLEPKEITFTDSIISYYDGDNIFGLIGKGYNPFIVHPQQYKISVASEQNFSVNSQYKASLVIPVNEYLNN